MKYAFIDEQRTQHSVRRMCRLLEVSPSGYYEWRERPPSARASFDETLRSEIVRIHSESRSTYGRPRVHVELRSAGIRVGAKRVGRLMKASGISGVRRRAFRKTTDSAHDLPIAPNTLDRKFDVAQIASLNRVWAGDITYLPTREGWLYLAVVLDLVSRRVIGWSMKTTLDRSLAIDAITAAIRNRRSTSKVLFHSDRGSQYASEDFRALLKEHGIRASMSRKAECWDNAVVESFFGTMKMELGDPIWESRAAARAAVFDYIEIWYNRKRRHSTLGYVSPEQYESMLPIAA
jgi:transposase InsO family protein